MIHNIISKLNRLLLVFLILFAISAHQNKIFNYSFFSNEKDALSAKFLVDDVREILPNATRLEEENEVSKVFDSNNLEIGTVLSTSPLADEIRGFGGSVPVLIVLNNEKKIAGVKLLSNNETSSYIDRIRKNNFFSKWNGLTIKQVLNSQVDGVSGATLTSSAINKGVMLRLSNFANTAQLESDFHYYQLFKSLAFLATIIFGFLSFIFPIKFKKYRFVLLVSSILVIGFWTTEMLSLGLFYSWLIYGVSVVDKVLLLLLLVLAVILPIVTNKAFYCAYVCPYGACQEITGKITKRKIQIPLKLLTFLSNLKMKVFAIIVFLLVVNIKFELSEIETFMGFSFQVAPLFVLLMAVGFIILSIFIDRPWCRYVCPTGQFLELFREKNNSNINIKTENMKKLSISDVLNILLAVAVIVLILVPIRTIDKSSAPSENQKQLVVDKGKDAPSIIDRNDTAKVKLKAGTFIYPMPTVIVGVNVDGKPNFLTVAFFGVMADNPPTIAMGWGRGHYSEKALLKNKTFSINIPHTGMVAVTDYIGAKSGKEVDKSKIFNTFYGELGNAPMIREASINHECVVIDTMSYGPDEFMIIARIVHSYASENVMKGDIPDSRKVDPILFSFHENKYWSMGTYLGDAWKIWEEYDKKK